MSEASTSQIALCLGPVALSQRLLWIHSSTTPQQHISMDKILSSTAAAISRFPNNSLHFLRMETQNQCNQTKFSTACLQQQFQWTLLVSTEANKELQHIHAKTRFCLPGRVGKVLDFLEYCDSQCVPIKFTMGSQQYSPGTQYVPQHVLNNTSLLSHMLCPALSSWKLDPF